MSVEIKFLDFDNVDVLTEAWGWADSAPQWFQQSQDDANETLDDFLTPNESVLLVGIFVDETATAVIRLTQVREMIFAIDLFAHRKTDWQILLNAGLSVQEYLFEKGVKGFFGWIPSKNRPIVKLYQCLGFVHRGIKCRRGVMHGRSIKWMLMEATQ